MMLRWLLLIVLLTVFESDAQTPQNQTPLLAFSLVHPSTAYPRDFLASGSDTDAETVYLYDPVSDTIQAVGTGDSLKWSPTGRYLGMADTINDTLGTSPYLGQMRSFSIYDFETGLTQTWEYLNGNFIDWSPEETYLIATGSVSSGMSGANAWVNFLNADGSGAEPLTGPGYVDSMSGMRGGISPLGWVRSDDHELLLVRDIGFQRDEYALLNPATDERTVIEGDLPPYRSVQYSWAESGAVESPDNRYAAVTRVGSGWFVSDDFTTFLVIIDMNTGETQEVDLPVSARAVIEQMAWRPCMLEHSGGQCGL